MMEHPCESLDPIAILTRSSLASRYCLKGDGSVQSLVSESEGGVDQVEVSNIPSFDVRVNGAEDHPEQLRDGPNSVGLMYQRGRGDLIASPERIAIVGSGQKFQMCLRMARKQNAEYRLAIEAVHVG